MLRQPVFDLAADHLRTGGKSVLLFSDFIYLIGIAKLFGRTDLATGWNMIIPASMPRLKGFRHPREIIAYAVWVYHRFALSTADVEDLLAERGVIVSRETIRLWVNRFGAHFVDCIRRDRPSAADKWHLDEVLIPINGIKYWL
jgi:putative transposase